MTPDGRHGSSDLSHSTVQTVAGHSRSIGRAEFTVLLAMSMAMGALGMVTRRARSRLRDDMVAR